MEKKWKCSAAVKRELRECHRNGKFLLYREWVRDSKPWIICSCIYSVNIMKKNQKNLSGDKLIFFLLFFVFKKKNEKLDDFHENSIKAEKSFLSTSFHANTCQSLFHVFHFYYDSISGFKLTPLTTTWCSLSLIPSSAMSCDKNNLMLILSFAFVTSLPAVVVDVVVDAFIMVLLKQLLNRSCLHQKHCLDLVKKKLFFCMNNEIIARKWIKEVEKTRVLSHTHNMKF